MRLKIYINNTLVDVNDELNLSFTYNISDVREPESRQASFSKTIVIPASKTNNKLFSNVFDVAKDIQSGVLPTLINFNPDFNPNKRADTRVTVDDLLVMEGYCQMLKVNKVNYEVDSYEIVIFNNVKNIFEEFGEDELTSLDLSEYDHTYDTPTVDEYSYGNPSPSYILGDGIIYNSVYNGNEPIGTYKVGQYPSIFVKTILDKIFTKYEYEYTSNFFNTTYFKKLCTPFVKKEYSLSQDEIVKRTFKLKKAIFPTAYNGNFYTYHNLKAVGVDLDETTDLYWDFQTKLDGGNFYPTTGKYIYINQPTYHTLYAALNGYSLQFSIPGNYNVLISNLTATITLTLIRLRNGVTNALTTSVATYNNVGSDITGTYSYTYNSQNMSLSFLQSSIPGDEYYITLQVEAVGNTLVDVSGVSVAATVNVNLSINPLVDYNLFYNAPINNALAYGDTLEINRLMPDKVKIKDFFSSLIKCFNLQVDVDKENPKNLIIEPYNDYFGSGTEKDWTSKLDVAKIEIIPMADLITNVFKFGLTYDEDLINKDYSDTYKETYGDYEIKVDNDFATQPKEIKPIFAASPCTRRSNTGFTGNVTYLAKAEDEPRDAKIRLLWYNGLETDDVTNPTVALRFDLAPSQLYYNTTTLTNNTLYGKFWKKYVEEVTDKNSKMVICYLNLTPLDIANFQFTDNIFIDGHFFRVNKIVDYNPLSEGLTKVELIKINYFAPLQEDTITIYEQSISYNVVEGGLDEIRDESATSFYNILEGGENEVRDLGATSEYGIVDGGQDLI